MSNSEVKEIELQIENVREGMVGNDAQYLKSQLDKLGELTRPLADTAIGHSILAELKVESQKVEKKNHLSENEIQCKIS